MGTVSRNSGNLLVEVAVVEGPVDLFLQDAVEVAEVDDHPVLGVGLPFHGDLEGVVVAVARGVGGRAVGLAVPLVGAVAAEEAVGGVEVDRPREEEHRRGF